jgi:hypothetical protein
MYLEVHGGLQAPLEPARIGMDPEGILQVLWVLCPLWLVREPVGGSSWKPKEKVMLTSLLSAAIMDTKNLV